MTKIEPPLNWDPDWGDVFFCKDCTSTGNVPSCESESSNDCSDDGLDKGCHRAAASLPEQRPAIQDDGNDEKILQKNTTGKVDGSSSDAGGWPELAPEQQELFQAWFLKKCRQRQSIIEKAMNNALDRAELAQDEGRASEATGWINQAKSLRGELESPANNELLRKEAWIFWHEICCCNGSDD